MGLFDQFPYTNFHELNLDWLIRLIKELENTVNNFVALNTIKYADPIQWNITTQYEANTVVVDPQTGTAYISSKAVPAGVALTNTEYWSVIFTLDIISANKNLTLRDDGSNVLATFASAAGDWLLWNGTLYKVSQAINVNEAYVDGYNLTRYTIELFISDLSTTISNMIGDLNDLDTTDKSNLVAAINEIVTNIGDLADLDTTDKSNLVAAINEIITNIGDLADLDTIADSNIVAAINETKNNYVTPQMFGALADGVNDDADAIQAAFNYAIANHVNVYFPYGTYYITKTCGIINEISTIGDVIEAGIKIYGNSTEGYFTRKSAPTILMKADFTDPNKGAFRFEGLMGITVSGLYFKSEISWTSATLHIGLFIKYCIGKYNNLSFYGFTRGISGDHSSVKWESVEATRCLIGMYMYSCGDSIYRDLHMNTNADAIDETASDQGVGLWLSYCGGSTISGGKFEYNRVGIRLDNSQVNISDAQFDVNKNCHIFMDGVGVKVKLSNSYFRAGGYLIYNSAILMSNAGHLIMSNCFIEAEDDNGNFGPHFGIRWMGTPSAASERYILLSNVLMTGLSDNAIVGTGQNQYLHVMLSNYVSDAAIALNNADIKTASYT